MTTEPKRERRDYRTLDGKRLPSVTTIINATLGWSTDGLIGWAYRKGVDAMADQMSAAPSPLPTPADLIDFDGYMGEWLNTAAEAAKNANAHRRQREQAADAGTLAHALIEARVCGREAPPITADPVTAEAAQRAFSNWLAWYVRNDPEVLATEQMLTDQERGFGGTFDCIARIDGRLLLLDWKTGKDVYDDVVIQLGAYDHLAGIHGYPALDAAAIVNTPVDGDVQVVDVPREQVDLGRESFFSLLSIYKARARMKLAKESR